MIDIVDHENDATCGLRLLGLQRVRGVGDQPGGAKQQDAEDADDVGVDPAREDNRTESGAKTRMLTERSREAAVGDPPPAATDRSSA